MVVARYAKTSAGIESIKPVVIKGTPTTGNPADPNTTANDLKLWRIPLDGINAGTPVRLFEPVTPLATLGDSVSPVEEQVFSGLTVEGAARGGSVTVHIVGNDALTTTQGIKVGSVKTAYRPKVPVRAIFGVHGVSWGIVSVDSDGAINLIHYYGDDSLTWSTVDVSLTYTI